MPREHTGLTIKEELLAAMGEWNLRKELLTAITTDNASNKELACSLLGKLV